MNRITVSMGVLGVAIALAGLVIVWFGIVTAEWPGVVIGMAWFSFGGGGAVFAWRTRYEL